METRDKGRENECTREADSEISASFPSTVEMGRWAVRLNGKWASAISRVLIPALNGLNLGEMGQHTHLWLLLLRSLYNAIQIEPIAFTQHYLPIIT